jgi:ribose-phosphate pyrophosphokinase
LHDGTTDERAREVITARLVEGHLVDDDYPSPAVSSSASVAGGPTGLLDGPDSSDGPQDPMTMSMTSAISAFQPEHALGGSFDAGNDSDDDDKLRHSGEERTITLVGDVKDKTIFIVDDMIDKAGSWIAAAETAVKRGGAKKVYCIATHGLFGDNALEMMEECDCIDYVVITNSFPVPPEKSKKTRKLIILDLSALLAESIRRHHYGERYVEFCLSRYYADGANKTFVQYLLAFPAAMMNDGMDCVVDHFAQRF